ncbi:MAG: hypothetical protein ABI321_04540 [Polyangia bacterium]
MWRQWLPLTTAALTLSACNPYYRFKGDSSAGSADPVNFMAAYLGTGGDPNKPGSATLQPAPATATDGTALGYFTFPFTGSNLKLTSADGKLKVPVAYNFDEDGTTACTPPKNYVYDQQRDDVRYDQQGSIFIQLPDTKQFPHYQPVIADVPVTSNGLPCQAIKSEDHLVKRTDVTFANGLQPSLTPNEAGAHPVGIPTDGVFYARPVIDPSIDVRFTDGSTDPVTGLGPQKWGWYNRYLIAWLDGGQIPVNYDNTPDMAGEPQHVAVMSTQPIYFPTEHPAIDQDGNAIITMSGALGDGYDLITAAKGDTKNGFSPLCQVFSFVPADPTAPEKNIADIDMSTVVDQGEYVWCIQVTK